MWSCVSYTVKTGAPQRQHCGGDCAGTNKPRRAGEGAQARLPTVQVGGGARTRVPVT